MRERLIAVLVVTVFFGLIWLYVREFAVLGNTMYIRVLLIIACVSGLLSAGTAIFLFRKRFSPWKRHLPEMLSIAAVCVLFMPPAFSWINRSAGALSHEPFEFVAESPYLTTQYGIIKGEKVKPSGYRLYVLKEDRLYTFQYKNQAYFPLTKPGETVLLPVRHGLLGFPVVQLY